MYSEQSLKIEERREKTEKKEELKRDSFFYFLFFYPKPIFFSPFFAVSKRKRRFARGAFVRLSRVSLLGVDCPFLICAAPGRAAHLKNKLGVLSPLRIRSAN